MSKINSKVKVNEAIPSLNNEGKQFNPIKRVAIYCRANNNHLGQNISYLSAIEEYEKIVRSNPHLKLIDIYSEVVNSTVPWQERLELKRMLQACENGEIDLIVTPSYSRISRSTLDLMSIIRRIQSLNVEIYFVKENIYSTDSNFDTMLTVNSTISAISVEYEKRMGGQS